MATYRATRALRVEIPSTRRQHVGTDGEDLGSTCHVEDVPAGEALTFDQVIAAGQSFFDENGQSIVFTDEDGRILTEIHDDTAQTVSTQLDVWLADGSIVIEKED